MFRAPVLVVHTCLGWAWLGLESQSYTLLMWVQQISYDVPLPSNTSSGKCCHTLAWLDSTRFGKFAWAWLGLASARLYYTAPYRFLVSMFHAPVLFNTHLLGLGWAWVGLSPDDKFDKLNSGRGSAWLGLARLGLRLYCTAPYRFLVSMFCAPVLIHWLGLGLGQLSPTDKFDKLKSMVGWIIIIFIQ